MTMPDRRRVIRDRVPGRSAASRSAAPAAARPRKRKPQASEEPPTPVTVETAVLGAIDHVVTADAVLYPINQANVTPKISAPVKRVLVNRGDHVRAGPAACRARKRAIWRPPRMRASISTSRRRPPIKPLTGATVPEDKTKAQADVQVRAADARCGQEAVRQPRRSAEGRRAGAEAGGRRQSRDGAGAEPARNRAAASGSSEPGEPARSDPRRAGAGERRQSALTTTPPCSFPTRKFVSPISGVVADRSVYPGEMPASGTPIISIVDISQSRRARERPGEGSRRQLKSAGPRASPDRMATSPAKSRWSVRRSIPARPRLKCGCRRRIRASG